MPKSMAMTSSGRGLLLDIFGDTGMQMQGEENEDRIWPQKTERVRLVIQSANRLMLADICAVKPRVVLSSRKSFVLVGRGDTEWYDG